jgi:signal transduction histidine kinase
VSHRLVELVRGIHDLAQCRTHGLPVNLDWCEAAEVAVSVELDFRLAGFERSLDLRLLQEVPAAFRFRADLRRLRQAVSELVQNAVKATPDGGRVAVTLSVADGDEGRQFVVTVADTGVGIPPEEHARIFEAFYELGDERHHHTSKHEFGGSGLGLGLSLALETARAHGGGIRVDSRPGEGAIFSLWIALEGTPSEP